MEERQNNKYCPVATTLRLIGGKYKAMILWHLNEKTLRFSELNRLMPEATPKMLTQQLREMENDSLVNRYVHPVIPPKVEYSLTDRGTSLFPIISDMYDWGTHLMKNGGISPNCSMTDMTEQIVK